MPKTLTLGSLFDGIGGWQLAAVHAGVKPIWSSEIEKFPCAVTKHHFPDTVQLGDITKIDADRLESVDIVCAGSPCQDLSVAGKREGLKGARSGLFMDAIRLVRRLRERTGKPRYFVWENVPGAFSSNKGMDFRAVLEEISQTEIPMPEGGKWAAAGVVEWGEGSLAWRVLDAQYWGVPQRRKRIFLVADFAGRSAGEILFEPEGLSGHIAEGRSEGKDTADGTGNGTQNTGSVAIFDMTHANNPVQSYNSNLCHTLTSRMGTGGNQVPVVMRMRSGCEGGGKGPLLSVNKSLTLAANCNDQTVFCLAGNIIDREPQNGGNGIGYQKDISYTLNTMDRHAVADIPHLASGKNAVGCLLANCATKHWLGNQEAFSGDYHIVTKKTVRRLTPLECERLQGLPYGYSLIDDKSCSDSARYKALGNGMAQPCADYVIRRIVEVANEQTR